MHLEQFLDVANDKYKQNLKCKYARQNETQVGERERDSPNLQRWERRLFGLTICLSTSLAILAFALMDFPTSFILSWCPSAGG